ncbi:MAG: hypothetical protein HUK26_02825 [Duodenibacillus sp.]|nr:hypothetical protein [Oscillospiraceae bacterium]MCF0253253.1 hypothetical protein [Duodenibacillus sp.]
MTIETPEMLLASLQEDRHFRLDGQGAVGTERKLLHSLRDAFSRTKTVQARNAALRTKMAEMLEANGMADVAAALHQKAPARTLMSAKTRAAVCDGIKEKLVVRSVLAAARGVPEPERRGPAARFMLAAISARGLLRDPVRARAVIDAFGEALEADRGDPAHPLGRALSCQIELSPGEFAPRLEKEKEQLAGDFRGEAIQGGMHDGFARDALRGLVRSIDKEPCPASEGALYELVARSVPDEGVRGFVTMMAGEAGLARALGRLRDEPGEPLPGAGELAAAGVAPEITDRILDLAFERDLSGRAVKAHLRAEGGIAYGCGPGLGLAGSAAREARYGACRVYLDMTVDLDPARARDGVPAFELTGRRVADMPVRGGADGRHEAPEAVKATLSGKMAQTLLGDDASELWGAAHAAAAAAPASLKVALAPPAQTGHVVEDFSLMLAGLDERIAPLLQGRPEGARKAIALAAALACVDQVDNLRDALAQGRQAALSRIDLIAENRPHHIPHFMAALRRIVESLA